MKTLLLAALLSFNAFAEGPPDPRFFANDSFQRQAPEAFALQPEAAQVVRAIHARTLEDARALADAIKKDASVYSQIQRFETLENREDVLRRVFEIEVGVLGIVPPELVLDRNFARGAYFDFDLSRPGPGKVIINPTQEKLDALLLLVHETRHSAQLQKMPEFLAAFRAQKALKGFSFLDFMTLVNEYEAFRFGNYTVALLRDFSAVPVDMGSYASQFDGAGRSKIDLPSLLNEVGPAQLLGVFNRLEEDQYRRMKE